MTENVIDQAVYQALVEMVGDDFIDEMVDAFLEEGIQFVADLESALAEQDVDRFRRAAHSLKSNSATFGAMELAALAKELEEMAREGKLDQAANILPRVSIDFENVEHALKDLKNG